MMRMIMMMLKIIMMMGIKDEDEDDIGARQVPIQLPIFSRLASCKLQAATTQYLLLVMRIWSLIGLWSGLSIDARSK